MTKLENRVEMLQSLMTFVPTAKAAGGPVPEFTYRAGVQAPIFELPGISGYPLSRP